ncbi:sortilin-related receptor-like [Mytilus californianus]|uniref:sortilin-related receptor-like n=1 Tax=Mytilus californianus TaxID=6549 RepID=UPI00224563E1|nr:sortilin-related receptor-like [Mytilus californianus]
MLWNFIYIWLVYMYVVAATHPGPQNNKGRPCPNDEMKCADGSQCIPAIYGCDGFDDCADGSDEGEACIEFECAEGYRKCKDQMQCIKEIYLCDAFLDCKDSSDEGDNCTDYTCLKNFRKCADQKFCYENKYKCDGKEYCHDGSDEKACPTTPPPPERRSARPNYRREQKLFSKHKTLPIAKTKPVFRKSAESERYSNDDLLDKLAELISRTN